MNLVCRFQLSCEGGRWQLGVDSSTCNRRTVERELLDHRLSRGGPGRESFRAHSYESEQPSSPEH